MLTLNKVEKRLCCLGPACFPLEYLVRMDLLSLEQPRFCREKRCESKGYSALNNNWLRGLRFDYTCVWQGIRQEARGEYKRTTPHVRRSSGLGIQRPGF